VELEKKKALVDEARERLETCAERLTAITRDADGSEREDTDCLQALERMVEEARHELAEITETLDLRAKTDAIKVILQDAVELSRERLRAILVKGTNSHIAKVLPRNPVSLEDIRDSLVLRNQGGASVGQTLAVSYAFLATLFGRGGHTFPFVVDSPALALDLAVRPEIARLVPELCDQFVAFTISSERDRFVGPLAKVVKGDVQYLTVFRKTKATNGLARHLKPAVVRDRADGVVVEDRAFFDTFDLENEEA
jgi:DNA sulfur modification protein DndD